MIALLMMVATTDSGGFMTGNKLYDQCKVRSAICTGYIQGAVDAASFYKSWGAPKANFCLPDGVTVGQMIDVTQKFLTEKPELRHLQASSLVVSAMYVSFPCPK